MNYFELISTLIAVDKYKTMTLAASSLRITQSAVSKRIRLLEANCNQSIIKKAGRNVELTDYAKHLIRQIEPRLQEIQAIILESNWQKMKVIHVGVAESMLASWFPRFFKDSNLANQVKQFAFHTHRSRLVLELVRSGKYDCGILSGKGGFKRDLVTQVVGYENFVQVGPNLQTKKIFSIEHDAETAKSIHQSLLRLGFQVESEMESFLGLGGLAKAGLLNAVIPKGVALALGIRKWKELPQVSRPITFIAPKSKYNHSELIRALVQELTKLAPNYVI